MNSQPSEVAGQDGSRKEDCLECVLRNFDKGIKALEPILVVAAAGLVSLDAYVYFQTVLPQVVEAHGTHVAVLHAAVGLWLLFNVLWNQALCTLTPPGCTLDADPYVLQAAATHEWRWCHKCNRGKPPLSHHCSICNRCVYKMDHHCPWMANCVGHANGRFFLLYLFYMWIGSLYSLGMSVHYVPHLWDLNTNRWPFLAFMMTVLSIAVFIAMCLLWGMHAWMVLSASGTLDMIALYLQDQEVAVRRNTIRNNPYNLGWAENWKEAFQVSGPWWWLRWMLPTRQRKLRNGWDIPRKQAAM